MTHTPMRMCVACRIMRPQGELIRFVKNRDSVELDENKRLFGRGAYICRDLKCIALAKKKKGLERHFKCIVPSEIYETAEKFVSGKDD